MALRIFGRETVKKTPALVPAELKEEKPAEKPTSSFYIDLRPKIITMPETEDRTKIDIRYPLLSPHAFAHIYWDENEKELLYVIEEPVLSDTEKELLELLQFGLEEMINISFIKTKTTATILKYLEKSMQSILLELGIKVSEETYNKLMYYIYRDSIGLNEIEPMMRDYYIEDIECNGDTFPIYIVHRKFANLRTNIIFPDRQKLVDFVEKLSQRTGRYVSYAKPILDGTLPDGSRVNATYTEDITTRGPTFTIRKFTEEPWTPIDLIKFNTADALSIAYLWFALEHKLNIMTVGETASGKTTFMNAISQFIPPEARICSIEDTRELNLPHINWLPSVTRAGFGIQSVLGEQYGEITLFDLLRETFRQAPDYVILGETRGKETFVLFQGMASGHPSLATFHAGSVATMVKRLETPPIELPASLIESLDLVVVTTHIKTQEKSFRRMTEMVEIIEVTAKGGFEGIKSNKLFEWVPAKDTFKYNSNSVILQKVNKNTGTPVAELEKEVKLREKLLQKMADQNIVGFKEVAQIINAYYKDKKSVLKRFGL